MNNQREVLAIQEFRRFANTYIYPDTLNLILPQIQEHCETDQLEFDQLPQPTIKFHSKIEVIDDNVSSYTHTLYNILKSIFVSYFNTPEIVKLARNKIHTEIQDEDIKSMLHLALEQIQYGNPRYLGLLFNVTVLHSQNSYLYL